MSTKPQIPENCSTPDDNVLLTISRDNICRLWSPSSSSLPFRFHLCGVVDPVDFPLSDSSAAGIRSVHWLAGEEVEKAINSREWAEKKFLRKSTRGKSVKEKSQRLREAMKEYSDVLFHVQSDGAMVLWAVQYLAGEPRRMPKIFVIMKTEQTVAPIDHAFFRGTVLVYHRGRTVKQSSIFFPAELHVLAHRRDTGVINCYTLSLDDFFATSWTTPHLNLVYSWCGHRQPTQKIVRHPNLSLAASLANDGEVVVFELSIPQIGLRTTYGLKYLKSFLPVENSQNPSASSASARAVAWLPRGPFLLIADSQVKLYHVQQDEGTLLGTLPGYGSDERRLTLLHTYYDIDANDDRDQSGQMVVHIVGVTSGQQAKAYLWRLKLSGTTLNEAILLSADLLHAASSVRFVSQTNDLDSIHAPYGPLGAHLFLTVEETGLVKTWHMKGGKLAGVETTTGDEAGSALWAAIEDFEIGKTKDGQAAVVEVVETDAFGQMAVVSKVGAKWELAIWGNEATGLEMRKEWAAIYSERVTALDWFFSSDGQHMLAVAQPNRVQILCQERLTTAEEPARWTAIVDKVYEWNESITAVAWLLNGSILVGKKQQGITYEKWLDTEDMASETEVNTVFSVADDLNGRLPDHHPQLMIQYLLWGKFDFVRYALSLLYHFVKLLQDAGREIADPPVPLWKIVADQEAEQPQAAAPQYDDLFQVDENFPTEKRTQVGNFEDEHAKYLTEQLTKISLPKISNAEQLRLVSLIDTILEVESQKRSLDENGVRYLIFLRMFVFSQKTFPSQLRSEGLTSRDTAWGFFSESQVSSKRINMYSESNSHGSQDILLDACHSAFHNKLVWRDARSLGMGLWVRNPETLRRLIETVARNQYMGTNSPSKDPVDCALFYLALKKKNVLFGLWKLAGGHPEQGAMVKFLANDFETERWKAAALKNAFALLGKQRYEYAVAFFLLGDKLKDAVNVCLKQLDDIQLAIVICRIYEGDDSFVLHEILETHILPKAIESGDRWLTSMVFTLLKQRVKALCATLMPLTSLHSSTSSQTTSPSSPYADPSLVIFYNYLRKSYRSMRMEQPVIAPDVECAFIYQCASAYERLGCPGLALQIIRTTPLTVAAGASGPGTGLFDEKAGEASKVLEGTHVNTDPSAKSDDIDWSLPSSQGTKAGDGPSSNPLNGGSKDLDWGAPASSMSSGAGATLDWGAPASTMSSGAGATLDWATPASTLTSNEGAFDWGAPVSQSTSGGLDWGEPVTKAAGSTFDDEYEAFKRSLGTGPDEEVLEDLDLSEDDKSEGGGANPIEEVDDTGIARLDEAGQFRFELETRNVRLYQWMLAMRIIQHVPVDPYELENEHPPAAEYESEPEDADFDITGEGVAKPPPDGARPLADELLLTIALQHVGLTFDAYLERMRDGASAALDETYGFLYDAILRRLSGVLFGMQKSVGEKWKRGGIRLDKLPKYLEVSQQKDLWTLIRKTLVPSKMMEFIMQAAEVVEEVSTAELLRKGLESQPSRKATVQLPPAEASTETPADEELQNIAGTDDSDRASIDSLTEDENAGFEIVWRTKEIMNNFTVNPLDHNHFAVGTHKAIREIDIQKSLNYLQREELLDRGTSLADSEAQARVPEQIAAVAAATAATQAAVATEAIKPTHGFMKRHAIKRNLSFDSMQKALAKSMEGLRRQSTVEDLDSGERETRFLAGLSSLESHPTLNYYLAGISEGSGGPSSVQLFQYGQPRELVSYTSGSSARITRNRFDPFGARFGATDTKGDLYMWRFEAAQQALMPSQVLQCHSNAAHDFTFLDSGSAIATAGISANHQ
ncbi:regulator of (H+)-ATPase in vacuolar membrane [Rhizophlyctis rosea]|uniref:Regulator of (H+)-ATPase in vacuolar membrane n=1 Tax=Rhizophlyctis rosea TaxID=64517 RepID=A0AAD5SHV1_9FUNG|nr:regulator of (H+)-ATPase in vacuolar membrane [Rhizophlyctis rosea]